MLLYADSSEFEDVKDPSAYYYTPVYWAVERGITAGTSPTTFSPTRTCTRGQIVTFLWKALGSPEPTDWNNPFSDVSSGDYFYQPVLWAKENGVTAGTSATTFSPGNPCTRGQIVTFLWKALKSPEPTSYDNPFTDVSSGDYFYRPVLWAKENGVTSGTTATTFSPGKACTRGQAMTFLYKAMNISPGTSDPSNKDITWSEQGQYGQTLYYTDRYDENGLLVNRVMERKIGNDWLSTDTFTYVYSDNNTKRTVTKDVITTGGDEIHQSYTESYNAGSGNWNKTEWSEQGQYGQTLYYTDKYDENDLVVNHVMERKIGNDWLSTDTFTYVYSDNNTKRTVVKDVITSGGDEIHEIYLEIFNADNGLWERTDGSEQEQEPSAQLSTLMEELSEIEENLEFVETGDVTDPALLSDIEEYNQTAQQINEKLAEYNQAVRNAKSAYQNLTDLVERYTVENLDTGYIFRFEDMQLSVTGNAIDALNGECENISSTQLEDGRMEYTMRDARGETFFLMIDESAIHVNRYSTANDGNFVGSGDSFDQFLLSAADYEYNPSDLETAADAFGNFMDRVSAVKGIASEIEAELNFIMYKAGRISRTDLVSRITKILNGFERINKVFEIPGFGAAAASVVSCGYDLMKIADLLNLLYFHVHPTPLERMSTESCELIDSMTSRINSARVGYVAHFFLELISISSLWDRTGIADVAFGILNSGLGNPIQDWALSDYERAFTIDGMLHYRVEGIVIDEETRKPLPGVDITCEASEHEVMDGVTDDKGNFSFEPLAPFVDLTFRSVGHMGISVSVPIDGTTDVQDTQDIVTFKEVALPGAPLGTVTGRHGPIRGATVTLDGTQAAVTNSDGEYRFNAVAPGSHTFQLTAPGYKPLESREIVEVEQQIDFTMEDDISAVLGTVRDSRTGKVLSDVTVTLVTASNGTFTTVTDENGDYWFTGIPYDTHRMSFQKEGYEPIRSMDIALNLVGHTICNIKMLSEFAPITPEEGSYNAKFWAWCIRQFDKNEDGGLSQLELLEVDQIDCSSQGFSSLKGIGYFTNLEVLFCHNNRLTDLDISGLSKLNWIRADENRLTTLSVSGCPALETLSCCDNPLKSLNLSGVPKLGYLFCRNCQLMDLDVSGLTKLIELACENNQLLSLNASGCTSLSNIAAHSNMLANIDVSGCASLDTLNCMDNQLASLNASGCSSLKILSCKGNQLSSLNLTGCASLEELSCWDNMLSDISLPGYANLKNVNCYSNELNTVNLSDCASLTTLWCDGTGLTRLDIHGCPVLNDLNLDYSINIENPNALAYLDASGCSSLPQLSCPYNQIEYLNVSGCSSLIYLDCSFNRLTALDMSGCSALASLDCRSNQLETLGLKDCTSLVGLECSENRLTGLDVSACPALDGIRCVSNQLIRLDVTGCRALQTLHCWDNPLIEIDASGCALLTELTAVSAELVRLDVSDCSSLQTLDCFNGKLTTLNVTGCSALTRLDCSNNQLGYLDLTSCSALTELNCFENKLPTLNVSGLVHLTSLSCQSNNLSSLELAGCTALTTLACFGNQLTTIDVSGCTALSNENIQCDEGVSITR